MAEKSSIPATVDLQEDFEFGSGGGRPLRMHVLRPKNPPATLLPAVVYIHGGWWRAGDRSTGLPRLIPLAERGFFGAAIEYRLTGEAPWPAQIEDCKCAVRFLRAHAAELGIDPARIGVWGASAGGHLVAILGSTAAVAELEGSGGWNGESSAVQAVVDWFGPSDLRLLGHDKPDSHAARLLGGPVKDNPAAAANASPVSYVSAASAPHLIMHGTEDAQVPLRQSELLHAALQKAGAQSTLRVFPGLGHEYLGDEAISEAQAFLDRHLRA